MEIDFDSEEMSHISDNAKDFLKQGLKKDQFERADCKQMLNHPWMSDENLISEAGTNKLNHVS